MEFENNILSFQHSRLGASADALPRCSAWPTSTAWTGVGKHLRAEVRFSIICECISVSAGKLSLPRSRLLSRSMPQRRWGVAVRGWGLVATGWLSGGRKQGSGYEAREERTRYTERERQRGGQTKWLSKERGKVDKGKRRADAAVPN